MLIMIHRYKRRNLLRQMKVGDEAFFYHSSCGKKAGIYGTMVITRAAYPDLTALDPSSKRYDPKAKAPSDDGGGGQSSSSTWSCVDVQLVEKWPRPLLLSSLKNDPALADMQVQSHSPSVSEFILYIIHS